MKRQAWSLVCCVALAAFLCGCSGSGTVPNAPDDGSSEDVLTSTEVLQELGKFAGQSSGPERLVFWRKKRVSAKAAEVLATVRADVLLNDVESLSKDEAIALSRHEGRGLSETSSGLVRFSDCLALPSLESLPLPVATALSSRPSGWLKIGVKEPVSDAAIEALAKFNGRVLWLDVKDISHKSQEVLSACPVDLVLLEGPRKLTSARLVKKLCLQTKPEQPIQLPCEEISMEAVEELCRAGGGKSISFMRVKSLTVEQAKVLARYSGEIFFLAGDIRKNLDSLPAEVRQLVE
jgi:hypothetical protein